MNKFLDASEVLILQEIKDGYLLHINNEPVKLEIENKEIKNDLTDKQMEFVKDYI